MISYNKYLYKISIFLIVLLPPSLVTGPFLPDLFLSIAGTLFIVLNFKKVFCFESLFKSKYIFIFFIFYALVMISTMLSYEPLRSLESSLFYFRFLFFSLAFLMVLNYQPKTIDYLIYSFSITFLVLYIDIFIQLFTGFNLTGYPIDDHGGINSFFGTNADGILGSYFVRLTPIFTSLIAFKYLKKFHFTKYVIVFLIMGSSAVAILAQERTSLALSLLPFFVFLFATDTFKIREKIIFILLIILFIFTLIVSNSDLYDRFIVSSYNQIFSGNSFLIFSNLHQAHYVSALKMFFEEPIFGIGPKMFRYYCDAAIFYVEKSCSTHPHNTYIQLLAETGIFAFLIVFSIFTYVLGIVIMQFIRINFLHNKNLQPHVMLIISALLISLWPIAPTGNFFNNFINVIYYFPVGILFYFLRQDNFFTK